MQTPMMSCLLIPVWHEWNTNANDIMMTCFALYMNIVTSCLACAMCMHMDDGTHALYRK